MHISLYASLLAMLLVALSVYVIMARYAFKVAIGDADEFEIKRRVRAQGNLAEYAPIFLIMLGIAEHNGLPAYGVHLLGMGFTLSRLSHAFGLLTAERYENGHLVAGLKFRMMGMIGTFISLGALAVILLLQ